MSSDLPTLDPSPPNVALWRTSPPARANRLTHCVAPIYAGLASSLARARRTALYLSTPPGASAPPRREIIPPVLHRAQPPPPPRPSTHKAGVVALVASHVLPSARAPLSDTPVVIARAAHWRAHPPFATASIHAASPRPAVRSHALVFSSHPATAAQPSQPVVPANVHRITLAAPLAQGPRDHPERATHRTGHAARRAQGHCCARVTSESHVTPPSRSSKLDVCHRVIDREQHLRQGCSRRDRVRVPNIGSDPAYLGTTTSGQLKLSNCVHRPGSE